MTEPNGNIVHFIRGAGYFMQEAPRGSFTATVRPTIALEKDSQPDPRDIWVNMGAGGLGDALLGLCAIKGYAKLHPDKRVMYGINENHWKTIALFDGGYGGLFLNVWDEVKHDFPPKANHSMLQINMGYRQELDDKARISRLERYCRNLGWVTPELPTLRDPAEIDKAGKKFRNTVVLVPFSAQKDRDYPLHGWLTIERELAKQGYKTLVVASKNQAHKQSGMDRFLCDIMYDCKAETLTGMMKCAACVVSNDSGPAHLAGMLGTRTIVLCGWSVGKKIFGFYPSVVCLQGSMGCNGCWTTDRDYDHDRCGVWCANLGTIDPNRVIKEIVTRVPVMKEM